MTPVTVAPRCLASWTALVPIAPEARGDDGLLDLIVFRDPGPFHALRYLWLVFLGIHLRKAGVEHRRVRSAAITAAEPVPVQLDGDPGGLVAGPEPWAVSVLPGAASVLVPDSYRVARAWRDARVTKIWAGSNEIMKELIGRDLGF